MKKRIFSCILCLLIGLLGACAQAPAMEVLVTPTATPTLLVEESQPMQPTATPAAPAPADELAPLKEYLSKTFKIAAEEVSLVEKIAVEWSDSCMGLAKADEMCMQVITPGYRVTLSTPQGLYVFHTTRDLHQFRLAESPLARWERSGGFAGICEQLIVDPNGRYRLGNCNEMPEFEGYLEKSDLSYLRNLTRQYATIHWRNSPPANSADMFTDSYILQGRGREIASETVQKELAGYLELLVTKLRQSGVRQLPGYDSGTR